MLKFYTTYAIYEDGLAHACDPTDNFDKAVDAYAETKDAGYTSFVFFIAMDHGEDSNTHDVTLDAQNRLIDRLNERGQEHPRWLA
jgi:hypothetical protein